MIIDQIRLHNYGAFKGRHEATLTPPSDQKPIVLFGGLNGGGKTTILEGLQIALYGKLAPFLRGDNERYATFLRKSINRNVSPTEGASFEVVFRSFEDGDERNYRVRRTWASTGKNMKESLEVYVDNRFDEALSDTWAEQVERFIPARLSHLFLFDGERIEALADADRSAEVLSTAIFALLGVDLVDQLTTDLKAINRRRQKALKTGPDRENIDELELQLRDSNSTIDKLSQELSKLKNSHERLKHKVLPEIEKRFSEQGGEIYEQRHSIELEQKEIEGKAASVNALLLELASSSLPFALVENLLSKVAIQADREIAADQSKSVREFIKKRDAELVSLLKKVSASDGVIAAAKKHLDTDRQKMELADQVEYHLRMSADTRRTLEALSKNILPSDKRTASRILQDSDELETKLEALDRKAAAVPDEEALNTLLHQRNDARQQLAEIEAAIAVLQQQAESAAGLRDRLASNLDDLLRAKSDADFQNKDTERFLKHSAKADQALSIFKAKVVASHARKLEQLILEGFKQLLRKKTLVDSLRIDPKTCRVELLNADGTLIPADKLSAGERQLLATSMLWGLARAAGKPLPIVVDTPLGRLDSSHRSHLIKKYFPYASHQVILLSTDEEIDEDFYNTLQNRIGHSYTLQHNDKTSTSSIEPGYFWTGVAQ